MIISIIIVTFYFVQVSRAPPPCQMSILLPGRSARKGFYSLWAGESRASFRLGRFTYFVNIGVQHILDMCLNSISDDCASGNMLLLCGMPSNTIAGSQITSRRICTTSFSPSSSETALPRSLSSTLCRRPRPPMCDPSWQTLQQTPCSGVPLGTLPRCFNFQRASRSACMCTSFRT